MPNINKLLARAGIEPISGFTRMGLRLLSGQQVTCIDTNGLMHTLILRNGELRLEPLAQYVAADCIVRLVGREVSGYRLTEKARMCPAVIVRHTGDNYEDLTRYQTVEGAWKVEQCKQWVAMHEEGPQAAQAEFESSAWVYTNAEILGAASAGEAWPLLLGYVEALPD